MRLHVAMKKSLAVKGEKIIDITRYISYVKLYKYYTSFCRFELLRGGCVKGTTKRFMNIYQLSYSQICRRNCRQKIKVVLSSQDQNKSRSKCFYFVINRTCFSRLIHVLKKSFTAIETSSILIHLICYNQQITRFFQDKNNVYEREINLTMFRTLKLWKKYVNNT